MGRSAGSDEGWLQRGTSELWSRAAVTHEASIRFPTHLTDGRGHLLDSHAGSSADCRDYILLDIPVSCYKSYTRFGDSVVHFDVVH